jgi:Fe2+ transport protein
MSYCTQTAAVLAASPKAETSRMCCLALAIFATVSIMGNHGTAIAQTVEPKVKTLAVKADPMKKAVLVGRITTGGMVLQLEIEGAESMWMQMGNPPVWGAHAPGANERYHVEFKVTDPKSKTRIPYADIVFTATNRDTGKTMTLALPPMWGNSGLHYSNNSALLGDGSYAATTTVNVPTFQRELKDKDLWSKPVTAKFHFRLKDGMLTEVSEITR